MSDKRKNLSAQDIRDAINTSLRAEAEKQQQLVQDVFQIIMDKIEAGDYFVKGGGTMLVSVRKSLVDKVWSDLIQIGKENKLDISYGYNDMKWFRFHTVIEITPRP